MAEFHFLRPLWFLALIPLGLLLWLFWHRHIHSRGWRGVCDPRLLPFLLVGASARQNRWPLVLAGLLGGLVIIALAGPAWQKLEQPVFREQSALVVILDLSRSMDATDIKPSRLNRARLKLIDLLKRRKEGQTALIVYAADAYVVSPLTDDSQTMIAMVKTLSTQLMPLQGSQPERAVQRANGLLRQAGVQHGQILLITDGVQAPQLKRAAGLVTAHGHRLAVLGVGTPEGAPISLEDGGFLKDQNGTIVIPKLDSDRLSQLAHAARGPYHTLTNDDRDLDSLLGAMQTHRLNAEREATKFQADHWREEGPWLLLLVLPFAALAFRRGYLLLLIVLCLPTLPRPVYALEWDNLWQRADQKAAEQLKNNSTGSPPPAEVFTDPEWKAAARYRAGQYQQALESLQGVDTADALYNKGNALAKLGRYQEALQAYDEALKRQADHEDAKYNREQVEKMMQQQQSDQSKKGGNQQKSEQQQDSKQQQNDQQKKGQQQNSRQQANQQDSSKENQQQAQEDNKQDDKQAAQQKQSQARDENTRQAQQAEEDTKDEDKDAQQAQPSPAETREEKERQQAMQQWLRRIPDDPGGLLRRKFQYEYQRKQAEGKLDQTRNGQQAW